MRKGILWRGPPLSPQCHFCGSEGGCRKTAVDLNAKSAPNDVDFEAMRRSPIRMVPCNSAIARLTKAKTPTSTIHARLLVLTERPLLAGDQKDFLFGLWTGACCLGTMACA